MHDQGPEARTRQAPGSGQTGSGPLLRAVTCIERGIEAVIATTLGSLMLMAIAVNVANGIGRTVFSRPLGWSEELLSYTLILCVFLGGAVVAMRDEHVKMDFISHLLPPAQLRWLRIVILIAGAIVCFLVAAQSWDVVSQMLSGGRRSVVLRIPMSYVHTSVFLGFVLMGLLSAFRGLRLLLQPELARQTGTPEVPV